MSNKYSLYNIKRDFKEHYSLYLLAVPGLLYYLLFHYGPMYGTVIAFKEFSPRLGITGSPWIGFSNFTDFFHSYYAWRLIRNTLLLNVYNLLWGFPAPIILALALNEVNKGAFKKTIQTLSYLPHFISMVVISGMILDFCSSDGIIVDFLTFFGMKGTNLFSNAKYFRTVYVSSEIWQGIGWGSIIYLAALSGIDTQMYDAADIDGTGRFGKMFYITIPSILPTIVILLILRIGRMMSIGFEKIFLLYNPAIYETADVISTFVYRKGLLESNYSYATAVGLFNSLVNLTLLITANRISRSLNETSLW